MSRATELADKLDEFDNHNRTDKYASEAADELRRLDRERSELWDLRPQITDPVHGAEPSLMSILKSYYLNGGFTEDEAIKHAGAYLAALTSGEQL